MENKCKFASVLKVFLIVAGVVAAVAGVVALAVKMLTKFFKITIEIAPEENNDECLCNDECCCDEVADDKKDEPKVEMVDEEPKE